MPARSADGHAKVARRDDVSSPGVDSHDLNVVRCDETAVPGEQLVQGVFHAAVVMDDVDMHLHPIGGKGHASLSSRPGADELLQLSLVEDVVSGLETTVPAPSPEHRFDGLQIDPDEVLGGGVALEKG